MGLIKYWRFFLLLLGLVISAGQGAFASSKTVLFVGNSYTYAYDMPSLIQRMTASVGDKLIYAAHTPAGATIRQHANSQHLAQAIQAKPWDFVALQTQSQESAFSQSDFEASVYPNMQSVVKQIRANYSGTVPLFFMTWGYENGVLSRCLFLPYFCTFRGMNDKLQARYLFYARENHGAVVPAATLWRVLRDEYDTLDLYESDGNHPSFVGGYANACAFLYDDF